MNFELPEYSSINIKLNNVCQHSLKNQELLLGSLETKTLITAWKVMGSIKKNPKFCVQTGKPGGHYK